MVGMAEKGNNYQIRLVCVVCIVLLAAADTCCISKLSRRYKSGKSSAMFFLGNQKSKNKQGSLE
jgi:hypothetical protein